MDVLLSEMYVPNAFSDRKCKFSRSFYVTDKSKRRNPPPTHVWATLVILRFYLGLVYLTGMYGLWLICLLLNV